MSTSSPQAVVIGASAGALQALSDILPALPENYPLPVMIVVHLPADKESVLAQLLASKCRVAVREAQDKEVLQPATVYIAPPDYHLLVEKDFSLSLSSEEEVLFSRPSIDVLFETAADAYGANVVGVILTGANEDGAKGLQLIGAAGGKAIVQDPSTAQAPTMPRTALEACPEADVLSLDDIAVYLTRISK